jgi:hypothetical protein
MQELYTLKATLDGRTKWIHLAADNEYQATHEAVGYILEEARRHRIWAQGLIELINPAGRVIRTMDPKPAEPVDLPVFGTMFHKMSGL